MQLSENDTNATWHQKAETSTIDSTQCRHLMQLHFYLGRIFFTATTHLLRCHRAKSRYIPTYSYIHINAYVGTVQAELLEYVAFKILKTFFLDPTYNKRMPSSKQALKPLYLISKRKINALSSAHLQMEYRKHHWKKKIIDCNQQNENRLGSRAFVKCTMGSKPLSIKTCLNLYTTILK